MKEQLTTRQAAELLEIDISTVRRWLRSGALPGVRIGGQYRTSAAAVANMVQRASDGQA